MGNPRWQPSDGRLMVKKFNDNSGEFALQGCTFFYSWAVFALDLYFYYRFVCNSTVRESSKFVILQYDVIKCNSLVHHEHILQDVKLMAYRTVSLT